MRGIDAVAVEPSAATSCGTSRQPTGSSPSARHASSTMFLSQGSRRKHIATPPPSIPVIALRERHEQARAVARHPIGRPGAPVRDRRETGERPVEELARRPPARVSDEADAAGIALAVSLVGRTGVVEGGSHGRRGPFARALRTDPPVKFGLDRRGG